MFQTIVSRLVDFTRNTLRAIGALFGSAPLLAAAVIVALVFVW